MAPASAHASVFPRGSAVLDYWLFHAEGLTVEPLGVRVEEVVVAGAVGRAEALVVRSRVTGRRRRIPVEQVAAVEPFAGRLLLARGTRGVRRPPARRPVVAPAARRLRGRLAVAQRRLRPQLAGAARAAVVLGSVLAAALVAAAAWLAPRAGAAGRAGARLTAQAGRRAARAAEQGTGTAARRARAALEARRARQRVRLEE